MKKAPDCVNRFAERNAANQGGCVVFSQFAMSAGGFRGGRLSEISGRRVIFLND